MMSPDRRRGTLPGFPAPSLRAKSGRKSGPDGGTTPLTRPALPLRVAPRLVLLCAAGAAGFFFGLPNAVLHLPFTALLHPFCLYLIAAHAVSDGEAAAYGWLLGFLTNAACLYWLAWPMLDVAGMAPPLVLPLLLALYAFLACYAALAAFAARTFIRVFAVTDRAPGPGRLLRSAAPPLLSGLAYGGFEVLNSVLFSGFPWLTLSSAFGFFPVMLQGAAYAGGYALSAAYAAAACLCASALGTLPEEHTSRLSSPNAPGASPMPPGLSGRNIRAAVGVNSGSTPPYAGRERAAPVRADVPVRAALIGAALLIPAALFVCGALRLIPDARDRGGGGTQARLRFIAVQGNIDQSRKWDREFQQATVEHYIRLSEQALAEDAARQSEQARAEIAGRQSKKPLVEDAGRRTEENALPARFVVWPETAVPFYFSRRPELDEPLRRFAARHAVYLGFGSIAADTDEQGGARLHNTLFLLSPQGRIAGRYDKMHLVPFGEYIPLVDDIPFLRGLLQGMNFSPGAAARPLILDGPSPLSLGPLICYEAVFPYSAQEQVKQGAGILLNVSNDAWFRKSSAPLQHLAHSAVRAVEQARPLIRATNTGISAVFDARGRTAARLEGLFTEGCLTDEVAAVTARTLYHRLHPLPELFLGVTAATALVLGVLRRMRTVGAQRP
ncbi:MAG: apolipoprotein N-acyltransferase [Desulfovibrio sp.]|nr:apolipoprotein N-acyltransferase [Desulfovibrio sp.]